MLSRPVEGTAWIVMAVFPQGQGALQWLGRRQRAIYDVITDPANDDGFSSGVA
jgi:hypothetical protein